MDAYKVVRNKKYFQHMQFEEDEIRQMDGEDIDLEGPIRDAIILNLPINPLCTPDCPGLCPECGEKWRDLPDDHAHQVTDIRWAGLEGLELPEAE